MENAGALALILALCLAVYASVISLLAEWKAKPLLALSAERAAYAVCALLTTASGILIYALLQSDFSTRLRVLNKQPSATGDLQIHGMVGRTGGVLTVMVVASVGVTRP